MPSLDDKLSWDFFNKRETLSAHNFISPSYEILVLLQKMHIMKDTYICEKKSLIDEHEQMIALFAGVTFQLETILKKNEPQLSKLSDKSVYQQLHNIKNQLGDLFKKSRVSIIDPTGRSFEEVTGIVTIEGWRHSDDYPHEMVAETFQPIIQIEERIIKNGRVVMGSPLKTGSIQGENR